ncbi:MAG TPA: hypothetical protein VIF08_06715, partial [Candidatus Limnocylindrales bacterium]
AVHVWSVRADGPEATSVNSRQVVASSAMGVMVGVGTTGVVGPDVGVAGPGEDGPGVGDGAPTV